MEMVMRTRRARGGGRGKGDAEGQEAPVEGPSVLICLKAPSAGLHWSRSVSCCVLSTDRVPRCPYCYCPHGNPGGCSGRRCNVEKLSFCRRLRVRSFKWWGWNPESNSRPLWRSDVHNSYPQSPSWGLIGSALLNKTKRHD